MKELAKIVDLLNSIDGRLAAIQTSVFDVDEINALLREVLKELKKQKAQTPGPSPRQDRSNVAPFSSPHTFALDFVRQNSVEGCGKTKPISLQVFRGSSPVMSGFAG